MIHSFHLHYAGRHAEALEMADRAAAFTPYTFVPLQASRAYGLLKVGRRDEALAAARVAARDTTLKPRWWADAFVVFVLRQTGQVREAEELTARLLDRMGPNNGGRATLLAAADRTEEAVDALARFRPGPSAMGPVLYSELCGPMRGHARFAEALEKAGYAEQFKHAQATLARMKGDKK